MSTTYYVTCHCQHCGGGMEFDAGAFQSGILVKCPHCHLETELYIPAANKSAPASPTRIHAGKIPKVRSLFRAAKNRQFDLVPKHRLSAELLMVRNKSGEAPIHVAAQSGNLDQIPPQFLTKQVLTLTMTPDWAPSGSYTTGTGYVAQTETALHIAVSSGHADQIPKQFLIPDYLTIPARGHGCTLLHYLAEHNRLDLVSAKYADSEMWNLLDRKGRTARNVANAMIEWETHGKAQYEARLAAIRNEPATEPQKEKLIWFGCSVGVNLKKGQASDALDECVAKFPEKDKAYYNRPATSQQLKSVRAYLRRDDEELQYFSDFIRERRQDKLGTSDICTSARSVGATDEELVARDWELVATLTYGEAKEIIQECVRAAQKEEIDSF